MIVIPSVDLRGGRCVRLVEGRADRETVFSDDPVAMAVRWAALGAERLHVVDLDGAFAGEPRQTALVAAIGKGNLFATQFHPEKSQRWGLRLIENFAAFVKDERR